MDRVSADVVFEAPCRLGEGSLWDAESERLYWVDIVGNTVFCFDPKDGSNRAFDVGQNVGTVVVAKNGNLVLGLREGVAALDVATGDVKILARPEPDRPGNRLNDGKCDPRGSFWVGSIVEDGQKGNGALYRVDPELHVERKLSGVDCSNGIVWTKDARTLYYVDTPTHQVQAFDFEPDTGAISSRRVVFEQARDQGAPDGMTIDADDHLWLALWGGSKVLRVNPKTAKVVFEVEVPVDRVTSCAFGGPGLDELYITTASIGASPERLREQPLSGSLFCAHVPFRGVPAPRFGRAV